MEFLIKINEKQRLAYIPKEIVNTMGNVLKIKPDQFAMIAYPDGIDLEHVIKSVEILLEDLKHQKEVKDGFNKKPH